MERDESLLIKEYLAGDEQALTELFSKHFRLVYSLVYRLVGNQGEAEDLTQEAFLKAWKNLKKFRQGESFKAWLLKIARNTAIDFLRKKKHLSLSELNQEEISEIIPEDVIDPKPSVLEELSQRQDKQLIERLLGKLPLADREVLTMYYFDELTFAEIAFAISQPLNTVKSRHRRALAKLREILDQENSG